MDINLFGGEKGGVGKSLVCRTAIQYNLDKGEDFEVFETDRSNPDIKRIYGSVVPCKLSIFSEGEKYEDSANQIFNTAEEKRVLVNLPAQVQPALKKFFNDNEIFDIAPEIGINFNIWFVSDGGYDSLNLLHKSLEYFQDNAKHIVVQNYGRSEDWDAFRKEESLQELIKKYDASIIKFPKFLGSVVKNSIDKLSLPFSEALEYKAFGAIERQRVKKFLREAYQAFESVGVF